MCSYNLRREYFDREYYSQGRENYCPSVTNYRIMILFKSPYGNIEILLTLREQTKSNELLKLFLKREVRVVSQMY